MEERFIEIKFYYYIKNLIQTYIETTENINIVNFGKLIAEAKSSRSGNQGVVHLNSAKIYTHFSHKISSFRITGPSLQMRL